MLILGCIRISWFAAFVSLACLAGTVVACLLRKARQRDMTDVLKCVVLGVPLGIVMGRINYLIFAGSSMNSFGECLNITNGGFGLYGVIFGVWLAALIVFRYMGCDGSFGELLDCLAVGGALAVTIGRFATCFTSSEVGFVVNFKLFAVYDAKQDVYNLAVYQLDGIYEALVLAVSLWFFVYAEKKFGTDSASGKTALLMIALHGTNQAIMDSMRADPLKLGLNEFIKSSQIIGITSFVVVLVYFMVKSAMLSGFGKFHIVSIPTIIMAVILGVFGEYRVGSSNYISNHLIMLVGMMILNFLVIAFAMSSMRVSQATQAIQPKADGTRNSEGKQLHSSRQGGYEPRDASASRRGNPPSRNAAVPAGGNSRFRAKG